MEKIIKKITKNWYILSQWHLANGVSNFLELIIGKIWVGKSANMIIFRADIDTFPTPGIVGFWPDKVLANKYQGYTFRNSSKYKAM